MEQYNQYDPSSIAASSKREQFLKEAEEYRLRRHIAAIHKSAKVEKTVIPANQRQYQNSPETNPQTSLRLKLIN
jgi:hypothetical protein